MTRTRIWSRGGTIGKSKLRIRVNTRNFQGKSASPVQFGSEKVYPIQAARLDDELNWSVWSPAFRPAEAGTTCRLMGAWLISCAGFLSMNRNAEFIPPQGRHVQEHRNNSNAFANVTLKRHKCRAPPKPVRDSDGLWVAFSTGLDRLSGDVTRASKDAAEKALGRNESTPS